MGEKRRIFVVSVVFFVFFVGISADAVNTREIDRVRNESVLDEGDFQIIEEFVAAGVQELVRTRDFTSIAKIRTTILARESSGKSSAATQYAERFSESARKYISQAFKEAEALNPEERKFNVILNLLILVDGLEDVRLVNLAMDKLNDENTAIRYWAVHSITNAGIVKQLNSNSSGAENLQLIRSIVEQLKGLVEDSGPEIIGLLAEFAAVVDVKQGEELLLQIADMRIKRYADWTVDYELLEATVLKMLYAKISSGGQNKSAAANRFGQLFSYAVQRYINGQDLGFLSDTQRHQLASVLVEIEKSCISNLLIPQSVIKNAIEREDYMSLLLEHNRLLGDETKAGRLAASLNMDYGKNPDGSKRTAPLVLPEPPARPEPPTAEEED